MIRARPTVLLLERRGMGSARARAALGAGLACAAAWSRAGVLAPGEPVPDTIRSPEEAASFVEILRWRAIHDGDRSAYTFLRDGGSEQRSLTYGQLDRRARAIAGEIARVGAAGRRALLLFPQGLEVLEAFFGSLYGFSPCAGFCGSLTLIEQQTRLRGLLGVTSTGTCKIAAAGAADKTPVISRG